ncbi:hypothetical protein [Aliishimia ponticola]|nr:hypothetical protein [Aliishimia ponticola]
MSKVTSFETGQKKPSFVALQNVVGLGSTPPIASHPSWLVFGFGKADGMTVAAKAICRCLQRHLI